MRLDHIEEPAVAIGKRYRLQLSLGEDVVRKKGIFRTGPWP
jgi:hypothetical protein